MLSSVDGWNGDIRGEKGEDRREGLCRYVDFRRGER